MKLGVLTSPLYSMDLHDTLEYLHGLGVQAVELGVGGTLSPGETHLPPAQYLDNPDEQKKLKDMLAEFDMEIAALSCHGNGVHPNKEIADFDTMAFERAVRLAEQLGVKTVVTFSGCPGDCPDSKYPNWVTCAWPKDFLDILDYQWNDCLIPWWTKEAAYASDHGIHQVALELHPGFCCYNTATLLKLRDAVGPVVGANFDPSHLIWQGMDPVVAIKALKGAIYHFHAKDTRIDPQNVAKIGVLDTNHYSDVENRAWVFRTVGYGHDEMYWKEMITALRTVGYDGVISIEHEDSMMSQKEGLEKAISLLKNVLIYEDPAQMWWA